MKPLIITAVTIGFILCGFSPVTGVAADSMPTMKEVNNAVEAGNWALVKRYIDNGGNVSACLHPPYHAADKPRCPTLFDYLYRYKKTDLIELASKKGAYAGKAQLGLDDAAANNMPRLAEFFIREGAKVNPDLSKGEVDSPPLETAVTFKNLAVAKVLIAAGADVNYHDDSDWSVLGMALQVGAEKIADLLVRSGAKLNMRSSENVTLIEAAAEGELPKYISILAQLRFDVNVVDTNGYTPLVYAVSPSSPDRKDMALETVKTLLKWGADPCYRDKSGKTARDYAIQNKLPKVVAFLYRYKAECALKAAPTPPAATAR